MRISTIADYCRSLIRDGFKGKVYCTAATAEIAQIILLDAAKIQEEDAEHKRKRHAKEGRAGPFPEVPLYTTADAEACAPFFSPVEYGQTFNIADGIEAALYDAGHVLGSSIVKVEGTHQRRGTDNIVFRRYGQAPQADSAANRRFSRPPITFLSNQLTATGSTTTAKT